MQPLHIAWLTENHPPSVGGMACSGDRIVQGLRSLGVSVDVYHFSARLRRWEQRRQQQGRYFACPLGEDPAHALNRAWSGLEADDRQYSHVLAFGGSLPLIAGQVFAAWLNRPLVSLIRGNDFDAAVFNPRRTQVLADAMQRSSRVCCVSRDKMHRIRALYPHSQVSWVANGIDRREWQARPFDLQRAAEWRQAFVEPGRQVLGLFGHLKAKKGLLFFLDALLRSGKADRFHLLLVGDITPEAAEWLEQREDRLSFTLLPFLDRFDLIPYYSACDYLVLPSFYDGMPNAMLEGMALGLPLIAAETGGMADVLEDGVHGYLFPPGDMHGCRRAITRAVATDAAGRQRLVRACQARSEDFDTQTEAEAYLAVLRETWESEQSASVSLIKAGQQGKS